MIKTVLFFFLISATYVLGQNAADRVQAAHNADQRRLAVTQAQEAAAEQADAARLNREARQAAILKETFNTNPWRIIDGATQRVNAAWCLFTGTITHARAGTDFVFVNGEFHPIYPGQGIPFTGEFILKHYPYDAADGDAVPRFMTAMPAGVINLRARSMHCLDYGTICAAPRTSPDEIAAAKKSGEDRALAANQAAAAQGDAYGLLRMGERYRDGDGVDKNLDTARNYLSRAAAAGDMTASNELVTLPASDTAAKQ
jgi:TPR repeat protein